VTEADERLLDRHHAGDESRHQSGERHQISAPAAPDEQREDRDQLGEQDDLLRGHAGASMHASGTGTLSRGGRAGQGFAPPTHLRLPAAVWSSSGADERRKGGIQVGRAGQRSGLVCRREMPPGKIG
jgi:hypothetical protein